MAFQQPGIVAVEEHLNAGQIGGKAVSKPHEWAIALFPRAKGMAAEAGDSYTTESVRKSYFNAGQESPLNWCYLEPCSRVQWCNASKVCINDNL